MRSRVFFFNGVLLKATMRLRFTVVPSGKFPARKYVRGHRSHLGLESQHFSLGGLSGKFLLILLPRHLQKRLMALRNSRPVSDHTFFLRRVRTALLVKTR